MRLGVLALLAALPLGGCGNSAWSDVGEQLLSRPLPRAEAEPTGRALRLTLGRRTAYATLLQESGDRRLWRTEDGLVVATEGNRVVATSGAAQILVATRFDGPDPLAEPKALLDDVQPAHRSIDLMAASRAPESMRFGVPVDCRLQGARTNDAAVLVVEERCRATHEGSFTNRFWVDAESGAMLRAEQWIGPDVGLLTVEYP